MVDERQLKTGTTTLALLCKDGIVLAADKRATSGYLVSHKKFEKIMNITDNIAVTVAGTVSDVQLLAKYIRAELNLKKIRTDRESTVKEAANLLSMMVYNNIRKMSMIPGISHFIIGGTDDSGFHIYDLAPDGSIIEIDDYTTSGSGSVIVYGVLETLFHEKMSVEEGIKLAFKSINAALQRDIASGNGINIVTITKDGVKHVISKDINTKIEI